MNENFSYKKAALKELAESRDIQYIINESLKILGNPVMVFDTSYNLLCGTENIVTDDYLWNEITTLGRFSHEAVDFFNKENFITSYARSEAVTLMRSDKLKYERINGKLFDADNIQIANALVIACNKPFENGDLELMEYLCEILSVKLQKSEFCAGIERVYQKAPINDVIDGIITDKKAIREIVTNFYINKKPNTYLAVIDTTAYDNTMTHLAYFRDLFRRLQPEYKYFIHLNNVIAVIDINDEMFNAKKHIKKLNDFFAKYGIYAGISSKIQSMKEIRAHYREAINALNYGLESMRNRNVYCYDNYTFEHLLNNAKNIVDVSKICHPAISLIQEYDKKEGTSLLRLFYTYLLYGLNIKTTASVLEIPAKEVSAGLKKIEKAFAVDFSDGDMLVNMFIGIKNSGALKITKKET